jgi:hypothetical protein
MKLTGENRSARGETCPSATFSTTNPTGTNPGSNPGLRGERPATNRLSHGTAISVLPTFRDNLSIPSSRVKQFKKDAGNTEVRIYIGNVVGCDWFSENVTLVERQGAGRRGSAVGVCDVNVTLSFAQPVALNDTMLL